MNEEIRETEINDSDSEVQRSIEEHIFRRLCELLDCNTLESNPTIKINEDSNICIVPDFYSENELIIGEIHARMGKMKPAQKHKVSNDLLKMLLLDKVQKKTYRKIIAVCSEREKAVLTGTSFLAEALREFEVEVILIKLPDHLEKELIEAEKRQDITR